MILANPPLTVAASSSKHHAAHPSDDQLAQVQALYDRALCLQAIRLAESIGPLQHWRGATARVLAGRLAMNVGAPKMGRALHWLAWRESPNDPDALYYYGRHVLDRRGPLPAWAFMQRTGDLEGARDEQRADWFALRASVALLFRDFDVAELWLDRAQKLCPQRPWLWVERSSLLEAEDRYDESLAAVRRALELRPFYRPAVQQAAHALQILDRDEEALSLLAEAAAQSESAPVVAQLANLQCELQRYEEAARSLDRVEELSPLMERHGREWLAARRSDVACFRGDFDAAVEQARRAKSPFHDKVAEHLSKPENRAAKRVLLNVDFVRQHHMTCAPATLSAISRFWSIGADHLAADHLSVVEEICYDGTPNHSERTWAETHGYVAREFTVTWDAAVALLDRGVPFTLVTVEPGNAHLQAVVGYDARRRTLLIRDPYFYYVVEMTADAMLERYRSSGPRGMALVPTDRAHLLDGIELKEAEWWDALNEVQRALAKHDRAAALRICDEMTARAPDHRLSINARRSLAAYDSDSVGALLCVEQLLAQFPDDANIQLSKCSLLRSLSRRSDYLDYLKQLCEKPGSTSLLWQMWAAELKLDAREHARAQRLLRRAMRQRPRDGANLHILAGIFWDCGELPRAAELYRFASFADDKNESFTRSFFIASRHLRQTDEALRTLRNRFDRFGKRSGYPGRTLFLALEDLDRTTEAFEVLDRAVAMRPEDAELLLFAAAAQGRWGRCERAQQLLDQAKPRSAKVSWLRAAAELANLQGQLTAALDLWRQVSRLEPLAMDAHSALARLIAETESTAAGIKHLRDACEQFPFHYPLRHLLVQWLREEGAAAAEPHVRELVNLHPDDCWARRELALNLAEQNRHDDAAAEADAAVKLDPTDAHNLATRGRIHLMAGQIDEGRRLLRTAVAQCVDFDYIINGLIDACDTTEQKGDALAFVACELRRQTIFGDGLLAYRARARSVVPPQELTASLKLTLEQRPDLWHAHSAMIQQLVATNQLDDAMKLADAAVEKFPLLPKLWLDRAQVCHARGDREQQIASLEQCMQISPGWGYAARELAGAYERSGQKDKALALLEQARARAPLDGFNYGCLADLKWTSNRKDEALDLLVRAVTLQPDYDWAWARLREWSAALNKPAVLERAARELSQKKPGEARSWLVLASNLTDEKHLDERLAALDRAAKLSPRSIDVHDLRARILCEAKRFEEAIAACSPSIYNGDVPVDLRARSAAILWNSGKRKEGIEAMQRVAGESPQHFGAATALTEWLREEGDANQYLAAAERTAMLAPHDPTAAGFLGEACLRAGHRIRAKGIFARAIKLAPDYLFGSFQLFAAHCDDNEFDAAAKVLEVVRPQAQTIDVLPLEVRLACGMKDEATAMTRFLELCTQPMGLDAPLRRALESFKAAGWERQLDAAFEKAMDLPNVAPQVAPLWVERLRATNRIARAVKEVDALVARGDEVGISAASALIGEAADAKQLRLVHSLVRRHGKLLATNDQAWGVVGYAFQTLGEPRRVVRWMSDWRERKNAAAWALLNMNLSLRRLGRNAEAAEVTQHALTLNADRSLPKHLLWRAADLLGQNCPHEANGCFARVDLDSLDVYNKVLHSTVTLRMLAATLPAHPEKRERELSRIAEIVDRLDRESPWHRKLPELRRLVRRALWLLFRRCGPSTPTWCLSRFMRPVLPFVWGAIVIAGAIVSFVLARKH
jgi:tetratricopeptide (TPR) repeat protein